MPFPTSFLIAILAASTLVSCATFSYEPLPSANVTVERDRALVFPVYQDDKVTLIISPKYFSSSSGDHIMLKVTIRNNGDAAITVRDIDFSGASSKDQLSWEPLKALGSKEFLSGEKTAFLAGVVFMAIGAGLESANAGRSTRTTSGYVYGSSGYGTYTQTTTTYDPTAAAAVNARNSREMADYQQNGQALIDELERNLFYSKKIPAKEAYYGVVFLEPNNDRFLKVELNNPDLKVISIEYERVKD